MNYFAWAKINFQKIMNADQSMKAKKNCKIHAYMISKKKKKIANNHFMSSQWEFRGLNQLDWMVLGKENIIELNKSVS